jgi:hypothetical protein
MSGSPDFRSWAARVADQAAHERDDREVLRLMSIAVYWERLADRSPGAVSFDTRRRIRILTGWGNGFHPVATENERGRQLRRGPDQVITDP